MLLNKHRQMETTSMYLELLYCPKGKRELSWIIKLRLCISKLYSRKTPSVNLCFVTHSQPEWVFMCNAEHLCLESAAHFWIHNSVHRDYNITLSLWLFFSWDVQPIIKVSAFTKDPSVSCVCFLIVIYHLWNVQTICLRIS